MIYSCNARTRTHKKPIWLSQSKLAVKAAADNIENTSFIKFREAEDQEESELPFVRHPPGRVSGY